MTSVLSPSMALHLLQALSFLWAGIVCGISFLEAPVKFGAPTIPREGAIDVGRVVFRVLNRVELGLAVLAFALLLSGGPPAVVRWASAGIGGILLLQTAWLLPILRAHAAEIIAGERTDASNYVHVGYGLLDALKVSGLLFVGWVV